MRKFAPLSVDGIKLASILMSASENRKLSIVFVSPAKIGKKTYNLRPIRTTRSEQ